MGNGLDTATVAPPPKSLHSPAKPAAIATDRSASKGRPASNRPSVQQKATTNTKFNKVAETEKTQFNKRVTQRTADVFDLLAIKTRIRVPDLLAEAADMLQEKYGNV